MPMPLDKYGHVIESITKNMARKKLKKKMPMGGKGSDVDKGTNGEGKGHGERAMDRQKTAGMYGDHLAIGRKKGGY